jgi:hypothetical protein
MDLEGMPSGGVFLKKNPPRGAPMSETGLRASSFGVRDEYLYPAAAKGTPVCHCKSMCLWESRPIQIHSNYAQSVTIACFRSLFYVPVNKRI